MKLIGKILWKKQIVEEMFINSLRSQITLFSAVVIFIFLMSDFHNYKTIEKEIKKDNIQKQQIIFYDLKAKTTRLLDKMMFDYFQIKPKLIEKHIFIRKELSKIKNPLKYNLKTLFNKINKNEKGRFDIYLTNENYIIKNTTFKNDLNFDLSFAKELFLEHKQKNIIGVSSPIYETSSKNFFSYSDSFLLPPNNRKILQISYNYGKYENLINPIRKYIKNKNILNIKVFTKDNEGFSFDIILKDYKSYKPNLSEIMKRINSSKNIFKIVKNGNLYFKDFEKNGKHLKEMYILNKSSILSKKSEVIYYVLFDEEKYFDEIKSFKIKFFVIIIFGLFIILIIFWLVQKYILTPILKMKKTFLFSEKIDDKKLLNCKNEFSVLSKKYNEMFDEIKREIKEKEELIKLQDEFVKDSTHEIKTPLTAIRLNNELRDMKKGEDKYSQQIEVAIKNLQLIYDDLSFGIKQDRDGFEKISIALVEFIKKRVEYFETIAIANNKKINFIDEVNCEILISEIELTRLIDNNLSNAIKYSKQNSIIFINLSQEKKNILLKFQNYGNLIKDKEMIFERYRRESSDKGGYGLGLSIVKKICEKNNIKIEVVSNEKEGNIFIYKFKKLRNS